MRLRAGAALCAASLCFLALVVAAAARVGANYEEVVAYVLAPLEIPERLAAANHGTPPRFVVSPQLPRLAYEPAAGVRLPLLNQPYMTDHLSYGGVVLAAVGIDPLWAARLWHAAFGLALLWVLYDVTVLLGLGSRAGVMAVAIAATGLPLTYMYSWARFDESLASWGTTVVLWAALRYRRDGRRRWIWAGVFAAVLAVSGKLTASWNLVALAVAGALAGWRPPPLRAVALPALVAAPLLVPLVGFALAAPATGKEVARRLGFAKDLFTTDVIPGTAWNLVDYLGNWGGILSAAMRGSHAGPANLAGQALVLATLAWLVARALGPGPQPRRRRLETQMLAFAAVVYGFVVLFFREHRDYQFALLVPLHAVAMAGFLEWCARRALDGRLRGWAAGAAVCALPVGSNLWDQVRFHDDLTQARNAMFHQGVQRASAAWLAAHGVERPIVVTFYATGTYELFTGGAVRPVYAFALMRHSKDRRFMPDLDAEWRRLLGAPDARPRYAVLPLGENPIEAQHFDEPAIRAALRNVAEGSPVAVFANERGEALLEVWRVTPRPAPG